VPDAHVDAGNGVTGEMLLGALVDAGASVERVEGAVRTLGVGAVKLAWAQVQRAGAPACAVRVHAPEETPEVPTWTRIREVLAYAALPEPVRASALEATRRLVAAEAAVTGTTVEDLDLAPVGALDTMAVVVAVCASVHELGIGRLTVGPIGVGTGEIAGPAPVPAPAVTRLLAGFELAPRPVAAELTTATGAALVATLADRGAAPPPAEPGRVGVGAGTRLGEVESVLRVVLH
jgi:uncharacterized protein (DUF111 family)